MNRRDFCKTLTTALIAWGLNPVLVLADNGNKILNGEFFIDCIVKDSHCTLKS